MNSDVVLDGSEGGGQLLRSALALSLVTRRPFLLRGFRAQRESAGLRGEHLACIRGALALGQGAAEGAEVGSEEIRFTPGTVKSGHYLVDVGTAGSAPLLFQCLVYPLALAGGGELVLRGSTHVPSGPSFHSLAWVWQPAMRALGLGVSLHLRQAGFFSDASGEIRAEVAPWTQAPVKIEIPSRGNLESAVVTVLSTGVPLVTAQRQGAAVAVALREHGILCEEEHLPLPAHRSNGSAVFVRLHFEHTVAGFTQLAERQQSAEDLAQALAGQVSRFMESGGAVDEHLADQLLLPAALLAAGCLGENGTTRYTSASITAHLTLHAHLVEKFLPVQAALAQTGEVQVSPRN